MLLLFIAQLHQLLHEELRLEVAALRSSCRILLLEGLAWCLRGLDRVLLQAVSDLLLRVLLSKQLLLHLGLHLRILLLNRLDHVEHLLWLLLMLEMLLLLLTMHVL